MLFKVNKETYRQHYVPRTYLQKFSNARKSKFYISASDNKSLEKIIYPNIANVCLENDMYTLTGETEEQRQALELFYSHNVESVYNEVYQTLTDDTIREIDESMHYKIVMTVITMLYRTSKWIHQHNELFDDVLDRMYYMCAEMGKDFFIYEGVRISIKNRTLNQLKDDFRAMKKEGQVLTQLDIAFRLIDIRKFDGLLVCKLNPECQLITSDNPVVLTNIDTYHLAPFDPENMIRLPLDSGHLLTILPHSQSDGIHKIVRLNVNSATSNAKMIANNTSQLESSFRYILGSKRALSNFIENRGIYNEPIREEQAQIIKDIENLIKVFK